MNWKAKSRLFRFLAHLPFGSQAHFAIQRHVTRNWPRNHDDLEAYAGRAKHYIDLFEQHSPLDWRKATFLEIGSGRDFALALALRMAGVDRVICVDIEQLARLDLAKDAADHLATVFSVEPIELSSWHDLEQYGIIYQAPARLATVNVTDFSIDCICTSEVLEHIPSSDLLEDLIEQHRLLNKEGLSIHAIDYSDHYARSDTSISRFNFLIFDEEAWKPHNSRFQYVNRLRHSEYLNLFSKAGLEILDSTPHIGEPPPGLEEQIAPQFRNFSRDDLFALRSIIVAAPKPSFIPA